MQLVSGKCFFLDQCFCGDASKKAFVLARSVCSGLVATFDLGAEIMLRCEMMAPCKVFELLRQN